MFFSLALLLLEYYCCYTVFSPLLFKFFSIYFSYSVDNCFFPFPLLDWELPDLESILHVFARSLYYAMSALPRSLILPHSHIPSYFPLCYYRNTRKNKLVCICACVCSTTARNIILFSFDSSPSFACVFFDDHLICPTIDSRFHQYFS